MSLEAWRCANGHVHYPRHSRCRECGARLTEAVSLEDRTGEVVTWTTATAPPPGVRSPNPLAIVAIEVEGERVTVIGGLVEGASVSIGDRVEPVYVASLRDPDAGIRHSASQSWDGYRFRPVDE